MSTLIWSQIRQEYTHALFERVVEEIPWILDDEETMNRAKEIIMKDTIKMKERYIFIGILIEENSGKLPLWLTPTQVVIASVVSGANNYAKKIYKDLISKNIRAKLDIRNEKINYKIREHSLKKIPIIYAVGLREVENNTVTVGQNNTPLDILPDLSVSLRQFKCKFCDRHYATTDGVRKHCRKVHADLVRGKKGPSTYCDVCVC